MRQKEEEQEFLQKFIKVDIHFETTGCRLNQIESESAAKFFLDNNFTVSLDSINAKSSLDKDVILCVVNTCAVTQKAEQKDRRIIRLLLEKYPNATIVVTGCYAQLSPGDIENIDARIATLSGLLKSTIEEVALLLCKYQKEKKFNPVDFSMVLKDGLFKKLPEKKDFSENAFKLSTDSFLAHSRSSLKIQDGCNNCCSYCTIHIARGHSVSLDAQSVIDRVKHLEDIGQNEVVFTTVNIAQYKGEYNGGFINFAQLLYLCLKNTKVINFRISSLYPEVVDDYFCEVIKNNRVRPHFHISVQSGSDSVLKNMARRYSSVDVLNACKKLKESKNNPFLACDIITGFPGESEEDFNETFNLCNECGFAWIHIFPFSERPGTPACLMMNKVPQSVSRIRAKKLGDLAVKSKIKYIESCIGHEFDAILETVKAPSIYVEGKGVSIYHAVTENFLHCKIIVPTNSLHIKPGSSIRLRITSSVDSTSVKGGEIDCNAEIV